MGKVFTIRWPKWQKTVEAELLDQQDSGLRERFWNSLPSSSIQSHAACAGVQMYCPFRLVYKSSSFFYEPMDKQPVGRVSLELDFQYLSINYGPMREPVPALPIAQVKDPFIDDIKIIGKMAWENLLFSKEFVDVHFKQKEGGVK